MNDAVPEIHEVELPFSVEAPRWARTAMVVWGVYDEADVVVSELVNNAVVHGTPPIVLRTIRTPYVVRIEVIDARTDMGPRPEHSCGLRLVEGFSERWGFALRGDGRKAVWAELSA